MRPEPEQFEDLRRLLVLKRYEQPPPGFHDRFTRQVMARIRAGEFRVDDEVFENTLAQVPWLQRFWAALETKPLFAGAFGAAICLLLVSGVMYSNHVEQAEIGANTPGMLPVDPTAYQRSQIAGAPNSDVPLFRQISVEGAAAPNLLPPQGQPSLFQQLNNSQSFQPASAIGQ